MAKDLNELFSMLDDRTRTPSAEPKDKEISAVSSSNIIMLNENKYRNYPERTYNQPNVYTDLYVKYALNAGTMYERCSFREGGIQCLRKVVYVYNDKDEYGLIIVSEYIAGEIRFRLEFGNNETGIGYERVYNDYISNSELCCVDDALFFIVLHNKKLLCEYMADSSCAAITDLVRVLMEFYKQKDSTIRIEDTDMPFKWANDYYDYQTGIQVAVAIGKIKVYSKLVELDYTFDLQNSYSVQILRGDNLYGIWQACLITMIRIKSKEVSLSMIPEIIGISRILNIFIDWDVLYDFYGSIVNLT